MILGLYTGPVRGGRVAANVHPLNGPHPGANLFYLELTQRFQSGWPTFDYSTQRAMKLPGYRWVVLGLAIGIAAGVGAYTFAYAKGWSYLTDNAAACANCHVMQEQYDGWLKSSHRSAAVCNDCHTPATFLGKYSTKAMNGFWHSFYFTTGWFEDNIQMRPHSRAVAEEACRKCHQQIVEAIEGPHGGKGVTATSCISCHRSVGHLH